jgi:S1-C subfamily serine protease
MSRPRFLTIIAVTLAIGCRTDVSRLDDVQKMAYGVKPAVVRISAYATAQFRYPSDAIVRIENDLRAEKSDVRAHDLAGSQNSVDTGAGGSGSGFIISPDGAILTSGHVVAPTRDGALLERDLRRNGAIAALVRHFPIETLREIYRDDDLNRFVDPLAAAGTVVSIHTVNQVELSNGETLPFRIRRYSPALTERGSDLAVLQIDRKNLPALPLGDSEVVRVGQSIWSVGYPAVASSTDDVIGGWLSRDSDLEPTFNPGTITAIKRNVANTAVFQSNVAIYRGNSGGPAVNANGEVIAISTWGHLTADQIKFLVPIDVARSFLSDAGVTPRSDGPFNSAYHAALDAANEGRWIDAKKSLAAASRLFPNSPDLIRFGRDADRAIASIPAWRLHPFAVIVLSVLAISVIGTAAFIALKKKRPEFALDVSKGPTVETVVSPSSGMLPHGLLGKFTILNGTRAGEKLGLGGSGIRIGRESAICEIVLENPKVSRLHAEVVSIDGKVLLIDRNSSNGTYVNDQKIDKRYLKDGDIIYFGGRNAVAVAFHA